MADLTVTLEQRHEPLLITARVPHGVVCGHPWGIALDGLLAAQIHAQRKSAAVDAGRPLPRVTDVDDPADLDLPLSRCSGDGDGWHWAATCAYPINGHELLPDVRTVTGFLDERAHEQLSSGLPTVVHLGRGRYRNRLISLMATPCSHLVWHAVGDRERVAELLAPVAAIGRRRAGGEGRVLSWSVEPAPGLGVWEASHLSPAGSLGRPCPPACTAARGEVLDGGLSSAGIRPPYMHRGRQRVLLVPPAVAS